MSSYKVKPNYQQPNNIRIPFEMDMVTLDREIQREHGRQKHFAKYQKSKQWRRKR